MAVAAQETSRKWPGLPVLTLLACAPLAACLGSKPQVGDASIGAHEVLVKLRDHEACQTRRDDGKTVHMRDTNRPPHEQEALFGGTGTVAVWDLLGRLSAPPFSAVLSCELEAGGEVGKHVQQRDPEIIIGLSGDGEAEVDELVQPLVPGSVIYLGHGQTLSIRNRSDAEPLRYFIVKAQTGSAGIG